MPALITIEEADGHLRLDLANDGASPVNYDDDRLPDLLLKMGLATGIVVDYLKAADHGWTADDVPDPIKAAILLVLGALYDDSAKAEMLTGLANGDLRNPVVALLYRRRDPAIA